MANISKIKLPSGTEYDIKDAEARAQIQALAGGDAVVFVGVSTTELTDGGSQTPTVGGATKTPATGQLFFYGTQEFIYGSDSKWHALGDLSTLGTLASKNSVSVTYDRATVNTKTFTGTAVRLVTGNIAVPATYTSTFTGGSTTSTGTFTPEGSVTVTTNATTNKTATVSATTGTATYTPEGSVSAPTISVATAGSTTTIKNPTSVTVAKTVVAAAPGATAPSNAITYYSVSNETLSLYQLGYTTGASITTSDVTVKNGDAAYEATAPTFTGTGKRLVTGNIAVPNTYTATFTGTEGSLSVTGTSAGSVSTTTATTENKTATVSKASSGTTTYTPEGSINVTLTQTGTAATVSYS